MWFALGRPLGNSVQHGFLEESFLVKNMRNSKKKTEIAAFFLSRSLLLIVPSHAYLLKCSATD